MPKVDVYNMQGEIVGEVELNERVFGGPVNKAVLHDAVVMQLASRRQGTASTKTRAEVRGGGRKPWRQKGTGRARVGSSRSPVWRTGGITFGPKPRKYGYNLPKKVRQLALRSALSSKVQEGNLIVVEELSLPEIKTREMVKVLGALNSDGKALVVTASSDENVIKSARNIPGVMPMAARGLNVYDILHHDKLIITKEAALQVGEVLANA